MTRLPSRKIPTLEQLNPKGQLARMMSEAELQKAIIAFARAQGWLVAHFRPAKTTRGNWITPVSGDGAGFPDLVLVKNRVLYVELKSELGKLSTSQDMWMSALKHSGENIFTWRPSQWMDGTIEKELTS
jgi:hypothetical protein|tara:strand:- start:1623 stop:2009 length:387 start_codon:yes stop_codon:yes gene_type:complete